jgi:hypothetical protein
MSIFNYKKITTDHTYIILIVFFAFFINWTYSKYGVFPLDTFLHYDSAYRILNGEHPIKDYWIVSGIFVDYLQALFFKIFGINWYSYILHSSIFNVILSILTFQFFISINLKKKFAFLYSLSFATLAYPISGTPFVDLHATFFCVIATYFSFLAIKKPENYLNWFLIVSFYFFAFLSKQVPTAYILVSNIVVIFFYLFIYKKLKILNIIFLSLLFYISVFFLLLKVLNLDFNSFYIQYIDYPRSIGTDRLFTFNTSLKSFLNDFKFILIPVFFLIIFKIKKAIRKKKLFFSIESINFLIFLNLCVSLILHQLLTKNQIYIYFLIPLAFAMLQKEIEDLKYKKKNNLVYLIIFLVVFLTIKYHIRYNEDREFHELSKKNISEYTKSENLDESLKGIYWISAHYKGSPKNEIEMLKKVKSKLNNKKNIMLISHYLFLDSITSTSLNYPSRTNTTDGTSVPMSGNKYFNYYKKFLYKKLRDNNISEVYIIKGEEIESKIFTGFLFKKCYQKLEEDMFIIFKLKKTCFN